MKIQKYRLATIITLLFLAASFAKAGNSLVENVDAQQAASLVQSAPDGLFIEPPLFMREAVTIINISTLDGKSVLQARSKGETVELLAADLDDGEYYYHIKTIYKRDVPFGQGADLEVEDTVRQSGKFIIQDHSLMVIESDYMESTGFINTIQNQALSMLGRTLDYFIPQVYALNLTASSASPTVYFNDTGETNQTNEWFLRASNGADGAHNFAVYDDMANHTVMVLGGMANGTATTNNSIVVNRAGDLGWANAGMFFDRSSQNFGIGTSNFAPTMFADLNIFDSTPDIRLIDESDDSNMEMELNNGLLGFWGRPGGGAWKRIMTYDVAAPNNSLNILANGDIQMQNNLLILDATTGKVSINGTNSNFGNLDINDNFPTFTLRHTPTGAYTRWQIGSGISRMTVSPGGGTETAPLRFSTLAPTNSMNIDENGRLGLGIASPTEAIDVHRIDAGARLKMTSITSTGNEAPQVVWRRARSNAGAPSAISASDNIGIFSFRGHDGNGYTGSRGLINVVASQNWTAGAHGTEMIFQTTPNNTSVPVEVMRITNDGKVRINGVELNVPDYVFEDDYELMTLDQLAAYIEENKHLPGVASAHEVNTQGLDLAGSQMSVLEKVEELTLYTLQQHAQLKQVQQLKVTHRELLAAYHAQQDELQSLKSVLQQQQQMVNQLLQSAEGKGVYTSLK